MMIDEGQPVDVDHTEQPPDDCGRGPAQKETTMAETP
jgi:hypothetical protein